MHHTNQPAGSGDMMSRQKWSRLQRIYLSTIFLLTAMVLVSVYLIMLQDGVFGLIPPWRQPIKEQDAKDYIRKHRNTLVFREQTDVITYDTADIGKYLREIYPQKIQELGGDKPGYIWQIGFYPMHRYDEYGERRLDFAVIPTRMKIDSSHVIDFYTGKPTRDKPPKSATNQKNRPDTTCNDCPAYDAGNIWP